VESLPYLIDGRAEWMADAACRGTDVNMFFPESMSTEVATAAVATCSRCPVQNECARYAIINEIEYGIYGGLTPRARREIASSRADRDRTKEQLTYTTYMEMRKSNRPDPVKATARQLHLSTASVYHHVRIIRFKMIYESLHR
jgi:WhiB family redox-sensing transcriptional regulator